MKPFLFMEKNTKSNTKGDEIMARKRTILLRNSFDVAAYGQARSAGMSPDAALALTKIRRIANRPQKRR
jgi:hypothetical protein